MYLMLYASHLSSIYHINMKLDTLRIFKSDWATTTGGCFHPIVRLLAEISQHNDVLHSFKNQIESWQPCAPIHWATLLNSVCNTSIIPLVGIIEPSVFPKNTTARDAWCGYRTINLTITIRSSNRLSYAAANKD